MPCEVMNEVSSQLRMMTGITWRY